MPGCTVVTPDPAALRVEVCDEGCVVETGRLVAADFGGLRQQRKGAKQSDTGVSHYDAWRKAMQCSFRSSRPPTGATGQTSSMSVAVASHSPAGAVLAVAGSIVPRHDDLVTLCALHACSIMKGRDKVAFSGSGINDIVNIAIYDTTKL